MAKSHKWFGTMADTGLVIDWLDAAGARLISGEPLCRDWDPDGNEIVLHFPRIGEVNFWPDRIRLTDLKENSPRWRRAVLAWMARREAPDARQVDVDCSAVAGLRLPEFRDSRYWVAGEV
jgi:hypothetical protein